MGEGKEEEEWEEEEQREDHASPAHREAPDTQEPAPGQGHLPRPQVEFVTQTAVFPNILIICGGVPFGVIHIKSRVLALLGCVGPCPLP